MERTKGTMPFRDASDSFYGRTMARLSRHAGLRVFRFFARELELLPARKARGELEMRLLPERDVIAHCHDSELDLAETTVKGAYSRGDLCVAAFDGRLLAGYCWLAFSATPHLDGVWAGFPPEVAWTYKSFVRRSHRGRGVAPALYCFADWECIERGCRVSIICIESFNQPSAAAAKRAGYRTAGYAAYLLRHQRLLNWRSPSAKGGGIRFYLPELEPFSGSAA